MYGRAGRPSHSQNGHAQKQTQPVPFQCSSCSCSACEHSLHLHPKRISTTQHCLYGAGMGLGVGVADTCLFFHRDISSRPPWDMRHTCHCGRSLHTRGCHSSASSHRPENTQRQHRQVSAGDVCVCVRACACMPVCVCMRMHACACVCVYAHVCVCVCVVEGDGDY